MMEIQGKAFSLFVAKENLFRQGHQAGSRLFSFFAFHFSPFTFSVVAFTLFTFHLSFFTSPLSAQQAPALTRILFLLDGSSSMAEAWGSTTRVQAAKDILLQIADSLNGASNVQLALRIYGHQYIVSENNCTDTKLEVPFASRNRQAISEALSRLRPKGITPIAHSLSQAAADFPHDLRARNIVVLITDGEESCGGDPCEVSLILQQKKIFLRPLVMGLSLNAEAAAKMECIGNYFNATTPQELRTILKTSVDRVLSSAAVQVNLLDAAGLPQETDVNMTFKDESSGETRYQFYHTITNAGFPDSMQLDPVPQYGLTVHTTPPIHRSALLFSAQKTDTVNIAASQGFLTVALEGKLIHQNLNDKIRVIVRKSGSDETIAVQKLYESRRYVSGTYDLEVLTLPRMTIRNVSVTQSTTTTVNVPLPGILSVSKSFTGTGSVLKQEGGRWVKIYSLNENSNNELIGLHAGTYQVIFRSKFAKRTSETIIKKFSITSGQTTPVKL